MSEDYESTLADAQSEIIAAALEFSGDDVDDVYVLLATQTKLYAQVFYRANGAIVKKSQLPDVDVSSSRQIALMRYVVAQLRRLRDSALTADQPVPVEARLHYKNQTGSLHTEFSYESLELAADESEDDLVLRWMESEEGQNGTVAHEP